MKITISGKQVDVGSSLSQHIEKVLKNNVKKYFEHAISIHVVFSKSNENTFRVDVHVNEGTGTDIIKAHALSKDAKEAFDNTLGKIHRQLSRYKGRIKNHHKRKLSEINFEESMIKGKKYVITPTEEIEGHEIDENPAVVAEKNIHIERLTVSEAVMKMDLSHLPALFFINTANNRLNVVYHRADGNISWVDPEAKDFK